MLLRLLSAEGWRSGRSARHSRSSAEHKQGGLLISLSAAVSPPPPGPFSHRALLLLEEREVPYERTYVDASNKPAWWGVCAGSGALEHIFVGFWLALVVHSLSTPEAALRGAGCQLTHALPQHQAPCPHPAAFPRSVSATSTTSRCRVSKANPAGTLPILKDLASGQFIADSDAISGAYRQRSAVQPAWSGSTRVHNTLAGWLQGWAVVRQLADERTAGPQRCGLKQQVPCEHGGHRPKPASRNACEGRQGQRPAPRAAVLRRRLNAKR